MDNKQLSPREQVEYMLQRARKIEENKVEKKEEKLIQVLEIQEEPQLLPTLFEPVGSLSLLTDVEETQDSILSRYAIDPNDYKSIKLSKEAAERTKKSLGRMVTGASASVPIVCRGDDCSYNEKCLDGDSLVLMSDLKTKKLRDVKIGDKVYSANKEYKLEKKNVLEFSVIQNKAVYRITTESGKEVICTSNHPFAIVRDEKVIWLSLDSGIQKGDNLLVVDSLTNEDFNDSFGDFFTDPIVEVVFENIQDVYDITVEDNANFIANDLLVHNCPFYKEDNAPVGESCPVEVMIAEYWTKKYMEDLNIDPNSITEIHSVSRLVEIAILENRLTQYMSIHQPDLMMDVITAVDEEGNEITNKASSISFEQRERLDKSRLKILESFAATREKKLKHLIKAQGAANESAHLLNIKDTLADLAQKLKDAQDMKTVG